MRQRKHGKQFKSSLDSTAETKMPDRYKDSIIEDALIVQQLPSSRKMSQVKNTIKKLHQAQSPDKLSEYGGDREYATQGFGGNQMSPFLISPKKRIGLASTALKQSDNDFLSLKPHHSVSSRKNLYPKFMKMPLVVDINVHFNLIDKSEFIFKVDDEKQTEKNQFVVFWAKLAKRVRLIRNQSIQIPKCKGESLVKVYGRTKIKFFNYLVTDYYDQNTLIQFLDEFGHCSEALIKRNVHQILKGILELHEKRNVFNVLGLDKIFYQTERPFVVDLLKIEPSPCSQDKRNNYFYCSPELLLQNQVHEKNDTWSIGCIILSMIIGAKITHSDCFHPYNCQKKWKQQEWKKLQSLRLGEKNGKRRKVSLVNLEISEDLCDLIEQCLIIDASARPTISELLAHPFFT